MGYPDSAYWLDVERPRPSSAGHATWCSARLASAALPWTAGEALVLRGAVLDPGAQVTGGTVIGAGSHVGAGARGCTDRCCSTA